MNIEIKIAIKHNIPSENMSGYADKPYEIIDMTLRNCEEENDCVVLEANGNCYHVDPAEFKGALSIFINGKHDEN